MSKITKKEALDYHALHRPGKIEVVPTKPTSSQRDLTLAYSPGVAYPCKEIEADADLAYNYTNKGNLVGVISNGTAVLGLGDIGALSGKPVMEGKALLFKIFAGIDVFDIEIDEKDPEKFVQAVKAIAPTFGGINLEDIKAPECVEIEDRLKAELNIPVMHDDQHGTAIISAAGLLNALKLVNKKIEDIQIVVNGAGAAANSCTSLYMRLGAKKEHIVMVDSKGVISKDRQDLNDRKRPFATSRSIKTLADAMVGADMFLGLSVADVVTSEMLLSMNEKPIVFALANPNPEISYEKAISTRKDMIFATGRSDYPNQINNVLGFPYIFRGALDVRASCINEDMKVAAVHALAALTHEPVPDIVNTAYGLKRLSFGTEYIIPKPLDPRLLYRVAPAVAKAAISSGIAHKPITDWDGYELQLERIMGKGSDMLRRFYDTARQNPKKVVFSECNHLNMLRAASMAYAEGICKPILLGNDEKIKELAKNNEIDLTGIEIITLRQDKEKGRRKRYAEILAKEKGREGITYIEAYERMFERNYFGMMMVKTGDADAMVTGVYTRYEDTIRAAQDVIGMRQGLKHIGAMHIVNTRKGTYFLADTLFNRHPDSDTLYDIAKLAHERVKFFNYEPVMAMLSYSNFGSDRVGSPASVHWVVERLHKDCPQMVVDGEIQVNFALDKLLRDRQYPFTMLKGKEVNTLIFPNLSSANIGYKLLQEIGVGEVIGPIQMGLNKPVHIVDVESSTRDIVNVTTIAVIDAVVEELLQTGKK